MTIEDRVKQYLSDIGECVLLDRQRLLNHFEDNMKAYTSLPCDKVILELLKLKETAYN